MGSQPIDSAANSERPYSLEPTTSHPTVSGRDDQITLETIVREAIELVNVHNVTPIDAADWTAAHYNYADIEAVLQMVREGVERV